MTTGKTFVFVDKNIVLAYVRVVSMDILLAKFDLIVYALPLTCEFGFTGVNGDVFSALA